MMARLIFWRGKGCSRLQIRLKFYMDIVFEIVFDIISDIVFDIIYLVYLIDFKFKNIFE